MFLSARAVYACLAMTELAARRHDPRPARLVDLADRHGIPQRFLVQILLQLKGAGLVSTTRGASGGYQLTREPQSITLADILSVTDRVDVPTERTANLAESSSALHSVWSRLTEARQKILTETTLADLASAGPRVDFVI